MAQPLLDFLTGRARQALPYLRELAARNIAVTDVINILKGFDLSFQRQRVLDVYAALQGRIDPERTARLVGQETPIPVELHNVAVTDLKSNYQYTVGAYDENGDAIGHVTVSSSIPLSAVQIRGAALQLFTEQSQLYLEETGASVNAVSIEEANRNGSTTAP